jgi:hypothetical protein
MPGGNCGSRSQLQGIAIMLAEYMQGVSCQGQPSAGSGGLLQVLLCRRVRREDLNRKQHAFPQTRGGQHDGDLRATAKRIRARHSRVAGAVGVARVQTMRTKILGHGLMVGRFNVLSSWDLASWTEP